MIGLIYYWSSGSMAGMNYNYSIMKETEGYLFHAEIQSENRIVDKEITKEQFDAIMKMVNDNYVVRTGDEPIDQEYVALDADSSDFQVIYEDERMQSIDLGQAGTEILSELKKLLSE